MVNAEAQVASVKAGRKYLFMPELLRELQLVYASGNKRRLGEGLDRLQRKTGWPRHALTSEARRRGWNTEDRSPWTSEEIDYLCATFGATSARAIAAHLGRSVESVQSKAERLQLGHPAEGHSLADLQKLFGVPADKVRRWAERGLLGKIHSDGAETRVTKTNLLRFLKEHYSEYDLRRVHQGWLKAILFGHGGSV